MDTVFTDELIKLPVPQKSGGMPLMQAMNERKTIRSISDEELDIQTISNILWAAYGVNRKEGFRTIPTARNQKDLSVYAATKRGVWLYEAEENILRKISDKNLYPLFETQDYVDCVPLMLIYVGSTDERHYAIMHAGSAYQNVGLYAASEGLANVVRNLFDNDEVSNALDLPPGQRAITSQVIGKPNI